MPRRRLHTGIYTAAGWTAVHALLESARRILDDRITYFFLEDADAMFDSSMEVVIDLNSVTYYMPSLGLTSSSDISLKTFGSLFERYALLDTEVKDKCKLQSSDRSCVLIGPMSKYVVDAKHIAFVCDLLQGNASRWDKSFAAQLIGEPLNPVDFGIVDSAVSELHAAASSLLELPFHRPEDIASFDKHKASLFSLMKRCMEKNSAGCKIDDEMLYKSFIDKGLRCALEKCKWET